MGMEILTETFPLISVLPLAMIAAALLCARLISNEERRLVGATAMLLAGVFFLVKAAEPVMLGVGLIGWAVGLGVFIPTALRWSDDGASRHGPLLGFVVLPPAVFGAFLLGGMLISMLTAPARLLARVLG